MRLRRRIVCLKDVQSTDSFVHKQSFRLFLIHFHPSVDQSLIVPTQLAYRTVKKGSEPCNFDLNPDLAA